MYSTDVRTHASISSQFKKSKIFLFGIKLTMFSSFGAYTKITAGNLELTEDWGKKACIREKLKITDTGINVHTVG